MKRILSAFCAAMLVMFVFALPVNASEAGTETAAEYHHVLDRDGSLSDSDRQSAEEAAKAVLEKNGVDLFVYLSKKEMPEPNETGGSIYQSYAATDASVVLMVDKKGAYIRTYGRAEDIFTKDELKLILKQVKKQEKTSAKCLKFIELTGDSLTEKGVLPIPEGRKLPRLVDDAGLLSQSEKYNLISSLDSISENRQLDVVVVTKNSLAGKTVEQYADDFFDYNGYGYGENDDGILLLLSMDTREWAISTYGRAIQIFTDSEQQYITDSFLPYLSEGNYYQGFYRFAELCDNAIEEYNANGNSRYSGNDKPPFDLPVAIVGSIVVGLIIGLIVALALKSQLTSVKPQAMATAYARPGSLRLTEKNDLFLYHNITRVARPKETSSSSGRRSSGGGHSSTHVSSSGRSHGGSHGHF